MRIGSLFSGAGGLDLAVQEVFGGEVVWHAEIDKAASKVLAHRFPGVPNLGDISAVDWADVPAVDVLCGGFPCQDVSAAGKRAGIKAGTRSGLWSVFADAIDELRPQWVVIENVRGLLSATAHRTVDDADSDVEPAAGAVGDGAGRPVLRAAGAVLGDLADLGYDAQWATVAAADVGAPHRRERVFILAEAANSEGSRRRFWDTAHIGETNREVNPFADDRGPASDAPRNGWDEGRPEPARLVGGFDAAVSGDEPGVALLPTPGTLDSVEKRTTHAGGNLTLQGAVVGVNPVDVERHAAAGRKVADDGVALLPTPRATDPAGAHSRSSDGFSPQLGEVVRQLGESENVVSGEDDGAVPVLPTDGGGDDTLSIALNGDGVAVDVSGCVDGHNAFVPVELAGTKPEPQVALLPTPTAQAAKHGAESRFGGGNGDVSNLWQIAHLLPTPRSSDCFGAGQHDGGMDLRTTISLLGTPQAHAGGPTQRKRPSGERNENYLERQVLVPSQWGKYAPAIARWESIVGPAPAPTEPNKNGNPRLSAAFSEWLMGWPQGWVTHPDIGISRNDQLRIIGNGVCPQQAIAALHFLLAVATGTHTHTLGRADMTELLPTPTSRDHKGPNQRGDTTCLHGAINSEVTA